MLDIAKTTKLVDQCRSGLDRAKGAAVRQEAPQNKSVVVKADTPLGGTLSRAPSSWRIMEANLFGVDRLVEDLGNGLVCGLCIVLVVFAAQCEFHWLFYHR